MSSVRPGGRVLTFYSYKGGTGRSMAMANVAWILACAGKRVLVIDWDLEAPGLHRYFRPFLIDEELSSSEGLLDMVDRYASRAVAPAVEGEPPPPDDWYLEYADFSDYLLSINFKYFAHGGRLDLLPAGRQGDAYAVKVSSFNWQNLYDRLGGGGFFEAVKARAVRDYDYVLIDSRTGVSDTAGICSVQMPDTLVVCFTYNNQSIKGAASVARSAVQRRQRLVAEQGARRAAEAGATFHDSPRPYRVFPVPMRVDSSESDRLALRQAFARTSFADLIKESGISSPSDYWGQVEVPYISFYAYEEVLAAFRDDGQDPKTVLSAFLRLTGYLTDGAVRDVRLPIPPAEKQQLLERFAETPLTMASRAARAEAERETPEEALVRRADAAFAALAEEQRVLAHRIFGRLVRLASRDEGGGILPIRASVREFTDEERRVIAHLADHQVVRIATDGPSGGSPGALDQTVSFVDPRIVRVWKPLAESLDQDRDFLLWRQQLRSYVADWDRSGRKSRPLVGSLGDDAAYWLRRRPDDFSVLERDFLEASIGHSGSGEVLMADPAASRDAARDAAEPILAPAPVRSSSWLLWAGAAAAVLIVSVLSTLWLARGGSGSTSMGSTGASRADVILAAASATNDPLERGLLLLELGEEGSTRRTAADLALRTLSSPLPLAVLRGGDRPATTVRFTNDGSAVVTGFDDGSVTIWRGGSSSETVSLRTQVGSVVSAVADLAASRVLVTGRNNLAEVWDLAGPARLGSRTIESDLLEATLMDTRPVMAHRDGGAGGTHLLVEFVDTTPGDRGSAKFKPIAKLPDRTRHLVFSGDGRWAVADSARGLEGWELRASRQILSSPWKTPVDVLGLLVSPTGAYVAAVTADDVQIWPVAGEGRPSRRIPYGGTGGAVQASASAGAGPGARAVTFALAPDGESVAVAFSDGTIRLVGGREPIVLREPSAAITRSMAFSPDGRLLVAAGGDGTGRILRTEPDPAVISTDWATLLQTLRTRTTVCLTAADRERLLGEPGEAAAAAARECEGRSGLKTLMAPRAAS